MIEIKDKTSNLDKDLLLRYIENLIDGQIDQVFEWSLILVGHNVSIDRMSSRKG